MLHSALDQLMLGAAFQIMEIEIDSLFGNSIKRFFGLVDFEANMEERWDSRGRKPNDPAGKFPVPLDAKSLIY